MSTAFSVAEILAKLEARITHHEQQVTFHQQQQAHHREQSAVHAAELETVRQHFESFKATAIPAAHLAGVPVAHPPAAEEKPDDLLEFVGKRITASKLIARVLLSLGDDETFGANRVAGETNRRYRENLKKPVDGRTVSVVLRRLRTAGKLHQVQSGGAAHEALYAKRPPG